MDTLAAYASREKKKNNVLLGEYTSRLLYFNEGTEMDGASLLISL